MRLAKALANAGVASRRASEVLITEGAVRVNGLVVVSPATNVIPGKDMLEAGLSPPRPNSVLAALAFPVL